MYASFNRELDRMEERDQPEVYQVRLPISEEQADVAGMPRVWFERAVRRLGRKVDT